MHTLDGGLNHLELHLGSFVYSVDKCFAQCELMRLYCVGRTSQGSMSEALKYLGR